MVFYCCYFCGAVALLNDSCFWFRSSHAVWHMSSYNKMVLVYIVIQVGMFSWFTLDALIFI